MVRRALSVSFGLLVAGLTAISSYLLLLTGAALRKRAEPPRAARRRRRFAILIPARNEEQSIGRLLQSISEIDYPSTDYRVFVVADNCRDGTAARCRAFDVTVHERFNQALIGKGFALGWLFDRINETGETYDAFLVIDADSVVSTNLLTCMNARLEAGAQIIQAYHGVLNKDDGPLTALRHVAVGAINFVRPFGRSALGLSCGLKGNGICFGVSVLEQLGRRWLSLNHDGEMHLVAVRHGFRAEFAPETCVLSEMPSSPAEAWTQNLRWERGRLAVTRRQASRALLAAVRCRTLAPLDAAADIMIPPLSVVFAVSSASLAAAILNRRPALAALSLFCVAGLASHLAAAVWLVGAPRHAYQLLGWSPLYVGSKVYLYIEALLRQFGAPGHPRAPRELG
jgi:1,2-diacylglycerol 3-beta-glucosyltransferase